ncbi:response regulator [Rhizobium sp. CFBP 8762]|uniref:response regulator n=1 Tax=Rhizobium sp. CFBP 8762 TaxID=2775279 RepID=UPI00177BB3E6|nr:response regulator [Rhizobium sp. CFBP 8762]MBD8556579.1 response regulator [Rhizobium sp. CFBP 8762]
MSLSTRIAPYLPYLRRYSRALTGTQTSGDAYVAAVLEAIISDISIFPKAENDRVALFKLYTQLFGTSAVAIPEPLSPFAWEQRASVNLASVSPLARQAFLLVSVEGFRPDEAAEVLGLESSEMARVLEQASQEISRQVATDIMIIEDEPLIAIDIEQMVMSLGHNVTGIARTRDEAVRLFNETKPSMVLADIQLADGSSGIDAVNDILKTSSIPVIFITAFPERLLTGERPEPTFLVTKPFNPDMVKALISQALFFNDSEKAAA